jgi:hypothetical protein
MKRAFNTLLALPALFTRMSIVPTWASIHAIASKIAARLDVEGRLIALPPCF